MADERSERNRNDADIRLKCLELAIRSEPDPLLSADAVSTAAKYYDFVKLGHVPAWYETAAGGPAMKVDIPHPITADAGVTGKMQAVIVCSVSVDDGAVTLHIGETCRYHISRHGPKPTDFVMRATTHDGAESAGVTA